MSGIVSPRFEPPVRSSLFATCAAALQRAEGIGPLLARVVVGLVFVTTGWGKLHNLGTVETFFASLHIPAPGLVAPFVAALELVGGVLIVIGLATRLASALLIGVMAVALWTAKLPELHGVVDLAGTIEMAYLAILAWLVVAGPGAISLDHLVGRRVGLARTTKLAGAA
ncbi:MAG: DoxX family protein [Myxococcota bacterium]|nr:DoxX family protein [Myxococcota bacterium]